MQTMGQPLVHAQHENQEPADFPILRRCNPDKEFVHGGKLYVPCGPECAQSYTAELFCPR